MKQAFNFKMTFIGLITLFFLTTACQMGVNSDLITGLTYQYNGLGVEEVVLSTDGKRLQSNDFELQSQVYMNFLGVNGFTQEAGKVFPGLSVKVTDQAGNSVLDAADLFTQYDATGLDAQSASELSSNLTIGAPMEAGNSYNWAVKIWDKKGEGTINANMDFNVN